MAHMTQILNEVLYLNQKVGSWKPFESFELDRSKVYNHNFCFFEVEQLWMIL